MKTCGELRLRQTRITSELSQQREQCLAVNKVCCLFHGPLYTPELDLYANIALCVCRYKHGKAITVRLQDQQQETIGGLCLRRE
jgi:hypothetical protein